MNDPLVSIGLPTYNGETYIKEALKSLLLQTYTNIEIIISDNNSSDKTAQICKRLMRKYPNKIRYYRQNMTIKPEDNFRFVLNCAKGTFFMWASDDDLWEINYIKSSVNKLLNEDKKTVLVFPQYSMIDNKGKIIKRPDGLKNEIDISFKDFLADRSKTHKQIIFWGLYRTNILRKVKLPTYVPFASIDILTIHSVLVQGNAKVFYSYKANFIYRKRLISGISYNIPLSMKFSICCKMLKNFLLNIINLDSLQFIINGIRAYLHYNNNCIRKVKSADPKRLLRLLNLLSGLWLFQLIAFEDMNKLALKEKNYSH